MPKNPRKNAYRLESDRDHKTRLKRAVKQHERNRRIVQQRITRALIVPPKTAQEAQKRYATVLAIKTLSPQLRQQIISDSVQKGLNQLIIESVRFVQSLSPEQQAAFNQTKNEIREKMLVMLSAH